jgi:hypothetical protein
MLMIDRNSRGNSAGTTRSPDKVKKYDHRLDSRDAGEREYAQNSMISSPPAR